MPSTKVFINNIRTAVPQTEVHESFVKDAPQFFFSDSKKANVYRRLANKSQIEKRYTVLTGPESLLGETEENFYRKGRFPSTRDRMKIYQERAFPLVQQALHRLHEVEELKSVSHVIVTSCTGFYAPGLDIEIVRELNLPLSTERTMIGFMGCYAAINAMKQAYHTVRSQPDARVLMVNLELCSLHLKESQDLEEMLAFLIFADGCSASVISSEEHGLEIESFASHISFDDREKIQWHIGDDGFDMHLSQMVPKAIESIVQSGALDSLKGKELWAVHPGGRSILDSVQKAFHLEDQQIAASREVLKSFGNMSSASVMFVLQNLLSDVQANGSGVAMGFGPGLSTETMSFSKGRF